MGILLMLLTLLGVQSRGVADGSSEIALKLQWREFTINYCRTDDDANLGSIRVVGMLMYENRLRRPILLLREPHSRGAIRLRPINPDLAERPEFTASPLTILPNVAEARRYGANDFVSLRPTGTYTEPYKFGFFFRKPVNKNELGLPPDGDYWASVQISVWPELPGEALRIGRELGNLEIWTAPLWSEPIRIQIRSDSPAQTCR